MKIYYPYGKRLLDLTLALSALLFLAPVLLLVAVLVRIKLGSPILFRQVRPGLHGQPFTMFKFRTMRDLYDQNGKLLPDADRLTSFGRFLRRSSLDELPELFNVLKGEMSLVGPRPLLVHYLALYTPPQMRRHEVPPGITGWAQVNGRNRLAWEQKFVLDVWYVDHLSFLLDLKIILLTLWKIGKQEGICQPARATIDEFRGPKAMPNVLLIGAGGHAQVVADILLRSQEASGENDVSLLGYLDDNPNLQKKAFLEKVVLGGIAALDQIAHDSLIIAIGDNVTRRILFEKFQARKEAFAIAKHPSAIVAPDVLIGEGTMLCAGTIVNPGTRLGKNVILNTGCTIDHHSSIGDHVHVAPGAHLGGEVEVGEGTLIGIGAIVLPGVHIGSWSIIGAGAVVTTNVPNQALVIGVPGRVVRQEYDHTPPTRNGHSSKEERRTIPLADCQCN